MAGGSASDKTEEPTAHKLREARKKGEIALSRDFSSALGMAVIGSVLAYQLPTLGRRFQDLAVTTFGRIGTGGHTNSELLSVLVVGCGQVFGAIVGVLAVAFIIGVVGPLIQIGPLFTGEPMKPKLEKLNPIAGVKRLFFSLPPYIELLKSILKVLIAGLLCWQVVVDEFREVGLSGRQPPLGIALLTGRILGACFFRVTLFFVAIAVMDLVYQRWQYRKNQRMSKKEIKDEYKQLEGDPQHKAARQRLHEEIATGSMLESVRDADVVVTNPDHIATALRFDPEKEEAPRLLGKGAGHLAERIKEIAREEGIPVIRNVSLARALRELELDSVIPEDLYQAAQEILRWVETVAQSKGQTPRWTKHRDEPAGAAP